MPAVAAALKDKEAPVRVAAANALGAMQPKEISDQAREQLLQSTKELWDAYKSHDNVKIVQLTARILAFEADPLDVWKGFEHVRIQHGEDLQDWINRMRASGVQPMSGQLADVIEEGWNTR